MRRRSVRGGYGGREREKLQIASDELKTLRVNRRGVRLPYSVGRVALRRAQPLEFSGRSLWSGGLSAATRLLEFGIGYAVVMELSLTWCGAPSAMEIRR